MKYLFYFFLLGFTLLSAQPGWNKITLSNATMEFKSVRFVAPETVYAATTFNGFQRSVDSGKTWSGFGGSLPTTFPNKMHWFNSKRGFIVGTSGNFSKTINGGQTWTSLPASGEYNGIHFSDTSYGVAVGKSGSIVKTTNGGAFWNSLSVGSTATLHGIWMIDSLIYYVAGQNGRIRKTTNGGSTWYMQLDKSPSQERFLDIQFITPLKGFAVSDSGLVYSTVDSGFTWKRYYLGPQSGANDVHFINENTGWIAASQGKIFKTTDGGIAWGLQTTGLTNSLSGIHFLNANLGISAGAGGAMLRTTNGGGAITTSVNDLNGFTPVMFSLSQNYPNPFNPSTEIEFTVSVREMVTVKVYDALGRAVATLADGQMNSGSYRLTFNGEGLAGGVYFYRLSTGKYSEIKKMLLLK